MQAPRSLSAVQRDSLESVFVCFQGISSVLQDIENRLQPDEKLMSRNLRELAKLCEHRLVEAFPELHQWLGEWTRGGVS